MLGSGCIICIAESLLCEVTPGVPTYYWLRSLLFFQGIQQSSNRSRLGFERGRARFPGHAGFNYLEATQNNQGLGLGENALRAYRLIVEQ